MVNKRGARRASLTPHSLHRSANPPHRERRHSDAATSTKVSEMSSAEAVVENSLLLSTFHTQRLESDADIETMEEGEVKRETTKTVVMSPRLDAQLGGYPPDCGTKELKYLSYAKVLRDRGMTHPMRYSTSRVDALGFALPERYPLFSTDFGAHSFQHLPTDSTVLSQYGIGIALYFKYLKVVTWLFLLLVVISAPPLAVYVVGGGASTAQLSALVRQDPPSVLGITSIGHLGETSSVCDQAFENTELSLACPAGEISFVKAVYSTYDTQGTCSCPERNKVAEASGKCRGEATGSICPAEGAGCFFGTHPVSLRSCCSFSRNETTKIPLFNDMRIRETKGCGSNVAQEIVEGQCLGKKSCTFNVSEATTYSWELDDVYGTNCSKPPTIVTIDSAANITKKVCQVRLNDDSDYSKCQGTTKPRALIVYARCYTARIDLSSAWSLKIIGWDSISRREFLELAVGCDIACSLAFFGIVIWLRRKEKVAVDRITLNQVKALDYTVQLVNLPPHDDLNQLRQEIRLHLESVLTTASPFAEDLDRIRVADVQFGKSASRHLRLLGRRGGVVRHLEVAEQRHEKLKLLHGRLDERVYARREQRHLRAINKLKTRLQHFDAKLEQWHMHHKRYNISQAVTAFVTFEEEEGFHRCLQEYPDLGWFHRLFQPYYKRLHGKRLRFQPAPDPTDIIWENLHYTFLERMFRQLVVALITLAVLFVSFVLIFMAKEQKMKLERQFGRPNSCPTQVVKTDVIQDELNKVSGLVPYKALVECYCRNVLIDHSFQSMMYESFETANGQDELLCRSWATTFVTTQVLSVASVLLVVAVNLVLARILNGLVALEKHHTESSLIVSRVTKIFLAQFCNTALLMLVINANVDYFAPVTETGINSKGFFGSVRVLNGEYSDFSANWFNDVGVALMLTMIINSLSTHAYLLADYVMVKARRFQDRGYSFDHSLTKQDTQRDLETLYRGPKFDLAARYAQSLTTIFITYMFSAGMPLLHFIGFATMMLTYWADKFTFLRIARSPPLYDSKLATAAGSLLPYAVLVHCLIAMWMFSNDRIFEPERDAIFENAVMNGTNSPGDGIPLFDAARQSQLLSRVTGPQVVVLFIFFVTGCATVIMRTVLFEYVPALIRSMFPGLALLLENSRAIKGIPNYFDAIPTSCLQDKLAAVGGMQQLLRPDLRVKYKQALLNRMKEHENWSMTQAAWTKEHHNQVNWIVGCHSYAICDNKEYVAKLAIDSHLSEQIPLDQIF